MQYAAEYHVMRFRIVFKLQLFAVAGEFLHRIGNIELNIRMNRFFRRKGHCFCIRLQIADCKVEGVKQNRTGKRYIRSCDFECVFDNVCCALNESLAVGIFESQQKFSVFMFGN